MIHLIASSHRHTEQLFRDPKAPTMITYRLTFKVPLRWLRISLGTVNKYFDYQYPMIQDNFDVDKVLTFCRSQVLAGRNKKRRMRQNAIKFIKAYERAKQ